jgi:hypothetical protein
MCIVEAGDGWLCMVRCGGFGSGAGWVVTIVAGLGSDVVELGVCAMYAVMGGVTGGCVEISV